MFNFNLFLTENPNITYCLLIHEGDFSGLFLLPWGGLFLNRKQSSFPGTSYGMLMSGPRRIPLLLFLSGNTSRTLETGHRGIPGNECPTQSMLPSLPSLQITERGFRKPAILFKVKAGGRGESQHTTHSPGFHPLVHTEVGKKNGFARLAKNKSLEGDQILS